MRCHPELGGVRLAEDHEAGALEADDELLVNTHVFGAPAQQAPVLHLRRVVGGTMVKAYLDSFELVWSLAKPLT